MIHTLFVVFAPQTGFHEGVPGKGPTEIGIDVAVGARKGGIVLLRPTGVDGRFPNRDAELFRPLVVHHDHAQGVGIFSGGGCGEFG